MIIIMDPEFHWDFHVNRVPFPLQTCIPNSIPVNILREIYQLLCKLYTLYTQFKLLHYLLEIFQKQTFLHSAVMFFSIIVIWNSINYVENLCEYKKKAVEIYLIPCRGSACILVELNLVLLCDNYYYVLRICSVTVSKNGQNSTTT